MLKIWGRINSANVRKVLWIAEELGLPYASISAGGAYGINDQPDYLAKNPNGVVPLIEDDDFILWESNAIVRYLAAQYGGDSGLYPCDPRIRACADKWMDWTTSTLTEPFRAVVRGVVRTAPDKQNWAEINDSIKTVERLLVMVDRELASRPYLSGDTFGMGDIPMGCFVYGWFEMPIERAEMPHLRKWYESLKQRPAYQKAVMTPFT